ncbi:hypothetical protein CDAR_166781 [Caerostris darwini]|uniref:Uncharacterized protein n=1 Tax=Caerostris darwini TaxID=1538125 RepID=A0AAV4UEF6_9ARAC|nr:hypothetical protein CDAR_403641 [Caerostris darwini]GIY56174.1 hypothetical protein CDAR_166781 [Caerostris darwini]
MILSLMQHWLGVILLKYATRDQKHPAASLQNNAKSIAAVASIGKNCFSEFGSAMREPSRKKVANTLFPIWQIEAGRLLPLITSGFDEWRG